MKSRWSQKGFTIVELLIVIVVIAILAAITIVAYNGIQQRARDSQRASDIKTIAKALELYYIDNGNFPYGGGSTAVNGSWTSSNDTSWNNLKSALVPKYISSLPIDPTNTPIGFDDGVSYSYAYYGGIDPSNCSNSAAQHMYSLVYRLESSTQKSETVGSCSSNVPSPQGGSIYIVNKE